MGGWDVSIGLLLIGIFLNTYLFGATSHQSTVYWMSKYNDPLWIRVVVFCLLVNDTIHSAVVIYLEWDACVVNRADLAFLNGVSWTVPLTICATTISALITQSFLNHRIFNLKKNKILTGGISLFILAGFVFGCCSAIYSSKVDSGLDFSSSAPFMTCWLAFQASANISITAVSAAKFGHSQARAREIHSGNVIEHLRGYMRTGLFTAIFSLCGLLSYSLRHYSSSYALFTLPLGRIYTNALLGTLNARPRPSDDPLEDVSEVRSDHSPSSEEYMADISNVTQTDSMAQTVYSNRVKKDLAGHPLSDERNVVRFELTENKCGSGSRLK